MNTTKIITSRPTLAALILGAGYDSTILPNPYNPKIKSWIFPMNTETATITERYYTERGLIVPAPVRSFLEGGARV